MHSRQLTPLDRLLVIRRAAFSAVSLILPLMAGCGMLGNSPDDPTEELRDQVRSLVSDEDRSRAMLKSVDEIDGLLVESAALMGDAASRERVLFLDYDSTRDDYAALFSETRQERKELQQKLLAAHIEFKSHSTAEEWKVLSSAQANAISTKIGQLLAVALERE